MKLLAHSELPSIESGGKALFAIDEAIGTIYDFPGIDTAIYAELEAVRIKDLLGRLLQSPQCPSILRQQPLATSSIMGSSWTSLPKELPHDAMGEFSPQNIKKGLWGSLKARGFSEFSDRLAHKANANHIEVVEIAPVDRIERKVNKLPDGLFRVGLGIYWPLLSEVLPRMNRAGEARPTLSQSHLATWLIPESPCFLGSRSTFYGVDDAQRSLLSEGIPWFSTFSQPHLGMQVMRQSDWQMFFAYPMMRGLGSNQSSRRMLLLACLSHACNSKADTQHFIKQAEAALRLYPDHLRERYEKLTKGVRGKISSI